jgi:hypothetical protein
MHVELAITRASGAEKKVTERQSRRRKRGKREQGSFFREETREEKSLSNVYKEVV